MKPNNIVICQERIYNVTNILWHPCVRTRYNYQTIETIAECQTVEQAVEIGRKLSTELQIPLTVSSKYLKRTETTGLKMF